MVTSHNWCITRDRAHLNVFTCTCTLIGSDFTIGNRNIYDYGRHYLDA